MDRKYVVILHEGPGDLAKLSKIHVKLTTSVDQGILSLSSLINENEVLMTYGWQDINGVEIGKVGDLERVEIETIHHHNLMLYLPYETKYEAKTLQDEILTFCNDAKE